MLLSLLVKRHFCLSRAIHSRARVTSNPLPMLRALDSTDKRNTKKNVSSDRETGKAKNSFDNIKPRYIQPEEDKYGNIGEEIAGKKLNLKSLISALNEFYQLPSVRQLAHTHYIDDRLFGKAFISFRRYCVKSNSLPPELYIKFSDISDGHGHITDLFPFFLSHARAAFPHIECREELRKISDLTLPHTWYPQARSKKRKIIYHAGPTNSGKTYHAMNRFLNSQSGIYCGPLKLLAVEIHQKANAHNLPCDLITGELQRLANPDGITKSAHASSTVEMTSIVEPVEVAVIDEIQMVRDPSRGWAWTRALLGVCADEVHLCGEEAAIDLVQKILAPTGDVFEIVRYKRLTPLVIENQALGDLSHVKKGDCIVCFSKDALFSTSMELERLGYKPAVVYGQLPPGAKLAQCEKFNRLEDCDVLVATDAIGMGLNLSIRRVIFHSLMKINSDERGNRSTEYLTTSQCLQIAGRAGRYKTAHETGYVTTLRAEDLSSLREIMSQRVEPIERAGLHPTADQIELFAYHLPYLSMSDLIELFVDVCRFDAGAYFICDMETFKQLAQMIEHIELPIRTKFVLCAAPINVKLSFTLAMFTKVARQFSTNEPITADWLKLNVNWPAVCKQPKNLDELIHLEAIFDVFEMYLWLSYRFPHIMIEADEVRALQQELDDMIFTGVSELVKLILNHRKLAKHIKRTKTDR